MHHGIVLLWAAAGSLRNVMVNWAVQTLFGKFLLFLKMDVTVSELMANFMESPLVVWVSDWNEKGWIMKGDMTPAAWLFYFENRLLIALHSSVTTVKT